MVYSFFQPNWEAIRWEQSVSLYEMLIGAVLFVVMPIMLMLIRAAEHLNELKWSRTIKYGASLFLLAMTMTAIFGDSYEWLLYFLTIASVWILYSETMEWVAVPKRIVPALVTAVFAVVATFLIPRMFDDIRIQPPWAWFASAAAVVVVVLTLAIAGLIIVDRRRVTS